MAEYEMNLMDHGRIARDTMAFWFDTIGAHYEFRAGQHADFAFSDPQELVVHSSQGRELRYFLPAAWGLPQFAASFTGLHGNACHINYICSIRTGVKDDAAFLEDLEGLATRNRSFTLIPTVTRAKSPSWPYENGPIDLNLLRHYLRGLKRPVYHLAGPSGMVVAMTTLLQSAGVSDDDLKTEEFGDYKQASLPICEGDHNVEDANSSPDFAASRFLTPFASS